MSIDYSLLITAVCSALTAVGGMEGLRLITTRKAAKKTADAEADASEFKVLKDTIEFLQAEFRRQMEDLSAKTELIRRLNAENIQMALEMGDMKAELVKKRCDDLDCPFRQPPNAYTPAHSDLTKEEYMAHREMAKQQTEPQQTERRNDNGDS